MSLSARLARALRVPAPATLLAADLDPDEFPDASPAAVLVGVIDREDRPALLLTKRNAAMRTHAGQVAFPGGRIDAGETPIEAALREANEELALDPATPRLVGTLDPYITGTGFIVTPVLAILPPDLPLVANEAEVDHWFEAPFDHLLDPAHAREEEAAWQGRMRRYWRIDYEDYDIWGATAAMIVNLSRRLAA
ncbi:CoA pyrophosphatase [Sphingomicrobium sp. XHP0239]|uniref:CoA pyrophosphatase n=1 Tax=Sphingomicrobium maritimum TaxID=3133972 RepID=UPI0031CCBDB0